MPKISVIIPIYKSEPYLKKCIDSVINQTFKDLEIILIDDGSPDNCGKICDEYASKDNRVKVIHKKNGGLSSARNAGLEVCTGCFVGFVDGDDYIDNDMYEFLFKNAVQTNADVISCCNYDVIDNIVFKNFSKDIILTEKNKIIEEVFTKKSTALVSVCPKLFKVSVIKNIRFDLGMTSEDVFFVLKWIGNTNVFVLKNQCKYYYVRHKDSITTSKFDSHIFDGIKGYKMNLDIIKELYPASVEAGEYRLWWIYRVVIERIIKFDDYTIYKDTIIQMQNVLRRNIVKILSNRFLNWKQYIAYILVCCDCRLYVFVKKKVLGNRIL